MKTEIINIKELQNLILAFADGDFSKRMPISDKEDDRDSLINCINMLGEELEEKTISRNYFSNVYNAVSDLLIVTDTLGIIKDVNETTIKTIKLAKEALIFLDVRTIVKDENDELKKILDLGLDNNNFETNLINSFEESIPLNCSISKITNNDNIPIGYLIIAKDITEKKNQERALLNMMIATEEKERKRLAYDLHDSLGQELNAIQMFLSSLNFISTNDKAYKKTLEESKSMLNQSINTVRTLSFDLMPKSLEEGCLASALESLLNKLGTLCTFKYDIEMTTVLSKDKQVIIYRVFQEFINNSLKHTSPCVISIKIEETNRNIKFLIEDGGKGFDLLNGKKGNGVNNITTRLTAINADFKYSSSPNSGTKLEFTQAL